MWVKRYTYVCVVAGLGAGAVIRIYGSEEPEPKKYLRIRKIAVYLVIIASGDGSADVAWHDGDKAGSEQSRSLRPKLLVRKRHGLGIPGKSHS